MTMGKPAYTNWGAKWGAMMAWIFHQQYLREHVLKLGPGGETGPVNDLVRSTVERIGANIMGKRDRDIRIAGGAEVIQHCLRLGVVDELEIALAAVLFGGRRRLFENLPDSVPQFRIDRVLAGSAATHLRYMRQ
jgi:dihydrofolate reductase